MPPPSSPSILKVYFATNRDKRNTHYGNRFYGGNPKLFRVGRVDVSKSSDGSWQAGQITTFDERSRATPENVRAERVWTLLGSESGFDDIRKSGIEGATSDVLVFIHGAANDFNDAAETLAAMTELYSSSEAPFCPFFFTYPANGKSDPVNYFADRDDASLSGYAMARAFGKLVTYLAKRSVEERCRQNVHLLAHSLGNFALRKAVEAIFGNLAYRPVRLFSSVILAAADDDEDTLHNPDKMRPLTRLADEIVVYYDTTDKLLRLSDAVHMDRLGQKGPNPHPGHLVNGCKISVVDCSAVAFDLGEDRQRHRHYLRSRAVVDDIRSVIKGEAPPGRTPVGEREGFYRL